MFACAVGNGESFLFSFLDCKNGGIRIYRWNPEAPLDIMFCDLKRGIGIGCGDSATGKQAYSEKYDVYVNKLDIMFCDLKRGIGIACVDSATGRDTLKTNCIQNQLHFGNRISTTRLDQVPC